MSSIELLHLVLSYTGIELLYSTELQLELSCYVLY